MRRLLQIATLIMPVKTEQFEICSHHVFGILSLQRDNYLSIGCHQFLVTLSTPQPCTVSALGWAGIYDISAANVVTDGRGRLWAHSFGITT